MKRHLKGAVFFRHFDYGRQFQSYEFLLPSQAEIRLKSYLWGRKLFANERVYKINVGDAVDWFIANKEWFFSGIGGVLLTGLWALARRPSNKEKSKPEQIIINNHSSNVATSSSGSPVDPHPISVLDEGALRTSNNLELNNGAKVKKSLEAFKNETRILFIDDDARFKVAKILVKSGWVHTKLIKDASTLDDHDITAANILFIDVQGVGVEMGFTDEGLGLALAIKEKYPEKKVVIYSAETKGDRFHAALRKADSFLSKNADPYEFQKIVEDFTVGSA